MAAHAQDQYILSRNFGANTRINLQYYLWKDVLGYVLHPSIPIKENMRVADIGSGTGIWMIELSRILPPTAQLDALDVNHDQMPGPGFLPANVHPRIHDCLSDPPDDLVGVYDVVHLQNFITVVRDSNAEALTRKLVKMLKPGGYIVWNEYDYSHWGTETLPGAASDYDDDLDKQRDYSATLGHTQPPSGLMTLWTTKLPEILASCGLQGVAVESQPFSRDLKTFLMDSFMVATAEISVKILDPLGGGRGDTMRKYIDAVARNRKYVGMNLNGQTVIGQKPEA